MGKIRSTIRKALNLPHTEKSQDKPVVISPTTHDILVRATEQGERLVRMEAPHSERTGNPFGDILERRVERGIRHV